MKIKLIFILPIVCLFLFSCGNKKKVIRATNEYTQEELVVIEFATRMEEQEFKYKDYHSKKENPSKSD